MSKFPKMIKRSRPTFSDPFGGDHHTPEPTPTGNGRIVLDEVMKDLKERARVGREKYGTPLKTNNGRRALVDAYQEALDMCMYLKQALMEQERFDHVEEW